MWFSIKLVSNDFNFYPILLINKKASSIRCVHGAHPWRQRWMTPLPQRKHLARHLRMKMHGQHVKSWKKLINAKAIAHQNAANERSLFWHVREIGKNWKNTWWIISLLSLNSNYDWRCVNFWALSVNLLIRPYKLKTYIIFLHHRTELSGLLMKANVGAFICLLCSACYRHLYQ